MISVTPVSPAVLYTAEIEEFTDGVFIVWDEWAKLELNQTALQEEIKLLRAELSKFE